VANGTTTTSANDFVIAAEVVASAILPHYYGHLNAAALTRYESIANFPSTAKNFPTTGGLSAAGLTEGTDMAYTQFSTGVATVTVAEAGLTVTPTDLLNQSDIVDLDFYAAEAGKATAQYVNDAIFALSSGFSNSVGSTGSNLTELNILDGGTKLAAAGVPGPYVGVLHPQQWNDLAVAVGGSLTPATSPGAQSVQEITRTFGVEQVFDGGLINLYGVNWLISNRVPTANAGADRAGMIVHPMHAIGFVEKWPIRVELERDASLRATEIVVTTAFGVGELLDSAGVGVITDA
jgi:hypothetical protein